MSGNHGPAPTAGARHARRLGLALAMTAVYAVVQVVAGLTFNSLALLSDAAHMWTDVVGLALALIAIWFARRPQNRSRTFGASRLEVLAAVANGLLLFGAAIYVLIEAAQRVFEPADVVGPPVLVVGIIGLLINLISLRLLSGGAKESINVRGAYLEVLADLIGSVGVVAAAVIVWTTGWGIADAVVAVLIGLLVLPRTYRLMRDALRILMEAAPRGYDVAALERRLGEIEGVAGVHGLRLWTITSGVEAASVHLSAERAPAAEVLAAARALLISEGCSEVTVQVESLEHAD